jgi:hypothetical protein
MDIKHRVTIFDSPSDDRYGDDGEFVAWSCTCGEGGTAPWLSAAQASKRHVPMWELSSEWGLS